MSNTSYLCLTDHPGIYPSRDFEAYDPRIHTIAAGVYCVPLTWLACFGPDSLVTQAFRIPAEEMIQIGADGSHEKVLIAAHEVNVVAPLAAKEICLDRLPGNISRLEEMISIPNGALSDYQTCLQQAIDEGTGEYLTIEWDEIICLGNSEEESYGGLTAILNWFDGHTDPAGVQKWLASVDFDASRPIYSPRGFYQRNNLADDDYRNLENLIGSGHCGTAPWER